MATLTIDDFKVGQVWKTVGNKYVRICSIVPYDTYSIKGSSLCETVEEAEKDMGFHAFYPNGVSCTNTPNKDIIQLVKSIDTGRNEKKIKEDIWAL